MRTCNYKKDTGKPKSEDPTSNEGNVHSTSTMSEGGRRGGGYGRGKGRGGRGGYGRGPKEDTEHGKVGNEKGGRLLKLAWFVKKITLRQSVILGGTKQQVRVKCLLKLVI